MMLLKDFIKQLQELYDSYDEEYHRIVGEPEIMIDVFRPRGEHMYAYAGFGKDIYIEKSDDGVYDIISTFGQSYGLSNPAQKELFKGEPWSNEPWPFPKSEN